MKANELMIGDWVLYNGQPKVVQMIDGYGTTELENEILCNGMYHNPIEVSPIPLTAEILEKNGFVKMDGDHYRYFLAYDNNYYVGFESVNYYTDACFCNVTKECSDGTQAQSKCVYKYVHELQHAMRLCGIEKEIEL